MKLALYVGPPQDLGHWIGHLAVCIFQSIRASLTARQPIWIPYSHCELVIGDRCYSSSSRDGGVRGKTIDLASGRWLVLDIGRAELEDDALEWFGWHDGAGYDWAGIFRFAAMWLPHSRRRWFCSEACAEAIRTAGESIRGVPHDYTPHTLMQYLLEDKP
jgi:hypothetical protein